MSSFPNEIFYNITNFLPNDDIADLMLMSRNFNALVTPRLRKIDRQMTTMNQSIESFMPSPAPEPTDNVWISQLNLKRFEPIGSQAKKRLTEAFYRINLNNLLELIRLILKDRNRLSCHEEMIDKYKEIMSLERYDTETFVPSSQHRNSVKITKFRSNLHITFGGQLAPMRDLTTLQAYIHFITENYNCITGSVVVEYKILNKVLIYLLLFF